MYYLVIVGLFPGRGTLSFYDPASKSPFLFSRPPLLAKKDKISPGRNLEVQWGRRRTNLRTMEATTTKCSTSSTGNSRSTRSSRQTMSGRCSRSSSRANLTCPPSSFVASWRRIRETPIEPFQTPSG